MNRSKKTPDELFRRHECLKRLLGEKIDTPSKIEQQDPVAAEYDRLAKQSLQLLDQAYLTGNEAIIHTAIALWNMAMDRRRYHSE